MRLLLENDDLGILDIPGPKSSKYGTWELERTLGLLVVKNPRDPDTVSKCSKTAPRAFQTHGLLCKIPHAHSVLMVSFKVDMKILILNFELNLELIAVFWEVRKRLKPGVDFGNEIASTW